MKTPPINPLKHRLLILLLAISFISAEAQKLPNVQQTSVRAPADIKIDGKATESSHFEAYNHATDVFYTMANDDENLYLAIQVTDPRVITKIMSGFITLTVNRSGKKGDKNSAAITFPVAQHTSYFALQNKKAIAADTSLATHDSIMLAHNKLLNKNYRFIRTEGIEGLDTLISVYNTDGVKVEGLFNNKKAYTCELAINLKHLGLSVKGATKFSYQIRVNGMAGTMGIITLTSPTSTSPEQAATTERFMAGMNATVSQLGAPTDFWGEYTLAAKP